MSPLEQMHFYDERHGSEMHVSSNTCWTIWDDYRFIVSDDKQWVRIDQTFNFAEGGFPYTYQAVDWIARKLVPGARLVASDEYGTDGEPKVWTRTYRNFKK